MTRRRYWVYFLVLTAAGIAIPFANSLALVVFLTILPVSFSNAATAVNAALTSDLLHSPADAGRAFAFLVLGGNVFGLLALVGAALSFGLTRFPIGQVETGVPAMVSVR